MEDHSHVVSDASRNEKQRAILLNQLKDYERAPKTLLESWEATTQQAEGSSTARIFLDRGGFGAWLAYFLIKNAAGVQYRFPAKTDCSRLIAELEKECGIPAVASNKRGLCD